MTDEYTALLRNSTWDLFPPPPGWKIIGCQWVYKVKQKPNGTVDRFKARLVAQGYTHQEGIDYDATFNPVIKPVTIRVVLSLALSLYSGLCVNWVSAMRSFMVT